MLCNSNQACCRQTDSDSIRYTYFRHWQNTDGPSSGAVRSWSGNSKTSYVVDNNYDHLL